MRLLRPTRLATLALDVICLANHAGATRGCITLENIV